MVPTPKSHPFPTLLCVPHPCLELGEELGTECERDGKLPVAARGQGLSVWCQGCGRSGRGGGFSAVFPPLCSAPSSQEGWYSLLHWGRNVPCVSNGLCPVLHWLLLIYTPPAAASCCPAPVALICPPPRAPNPAPQSPRLTELVSSPLSPWSGGQPSEFILEGEGKLQKGSGSPQFMFLLSLSPSSPLPSPPLQLLCV